MRATFLQLARKLLHTRVGLYRKGREWSLIEPAELARFLQHFRVDCVFDVGANEGQYARRLRSIGYKGLILSFEPHPEMAAKLRRAARNDALWVVHEQALDSVSRSVDFNITFASEFSSLHAPSDKGAEAFPDHAPVLKKIEIRTQVLDEIFPELQRSLGFSRPLLKLDTQGHDMEVLKGGRSVVENFIGLQSELAFTNLYKDAPSFADSLAYYQSLGFRLSALFPNNAGHFPDLLEMDCLMYRA